mgnify:FL=1|tara:strand:+ start:75 stop:710 length:636 start_codon:yes stop_codon:yes gene_type:complete
MSLARIDSALEDIKSGVPVIVVDDEDRENEGDLVVSAENASPQIINFMAKHGRGLICAPMDGARLDKLGIPAMVTDNTDPHKTAFTVSVDYADETSTGISAFDRSRTIKTLFDPEAKPSDLTKPGHVFPLRAKKGGVLERRGHTEASVDLSVLSGGPPVAVICEILNDDGTMARMDDLEVFSSKHGLKIISIDDLVKYRKEIASADLEGHC